MELKSNRICYFLGANTAEGFTSFYEEFVHPENGDFIWYIKGGPGNGKSTFMRRIAQRAEDLGERVEYAVCSGDPDSLDGIRLLDRHFTYVDATSPHVQEPEEPASTGRYLDFSGCFLPGLEIKGTEIRRLFRAYREQYARCYQLLKAAELASPEKTPGLIREEDRHAVRKKAAAFAKRTLRPGNGFILEHRFLAAYTCAGYVFFRETMEAAERVCTLDNTLGLADDFLREIFKQCQKKACPCVLFPDPLQPDRLSGILIPSCSLAVISVKKGSDYPGSVWKHFRLDAVADPSAMRQHREEYRRNAVIQAGLIRQAESSLRRAKQFHDELEAVYRPYLEIDKIDGLLEEHMSMIFGKNHS